MIYFTLLSLAYTVTPSVICIDSNLAVFLFASIAAEKFIYGGTTMPQQGPTDSISINQKRSL